jgi:hypothetical protein
VGVVMPSAGALGKTLQRVERAISQAVSRPDLCRTSPIFTQSMGEIGR